MPVCKERVEALLTAGFEEEDREFLVGLSEERFSRLQEALAAKETPGNEDAGTEADPDAGSQAKTETPETLEEYLAKAPPGVRDVLTRSMRRDAEAREKLIGALLANKRNKFTREQLQARDLGELEALAELARVEPDYSGRGPEGRRPMSGPTASWIGPWF